MAWSYQLRYVKCGKRGCTVCQDGPAHGPYWYGYEHVGGRMRTKYFGKLPPDAAFAKARPEAKPDPRWVYKGKMNWNTALRIMGFLYHPGDKPLQKRWRELVSQHHPDRGGDVKICAAINVAYEYLKH